jgi:16S rRNA (adenine1518-N6/adenine1519-N6)-dimethyltransferase
VDEVKNNHFWPVPQVDSAIIKIILSKRATIRMEDQAFFKLVKIGFAQKRKLLIKNILPTIGKEHKEKFLSELKKMGFTETVRAQELSVANWQQLVKISTLL